MKENNYSNPTNEMRDFNYLPELGLHSTGPPNHLNGSLIQSGQNLIYSDITPNTSGVNLSHDLTNHNIVDPINNSMSLMNNLNGPNGALLCSSDNYSPSVLLPLERAAPIDANDHKYPESANVPNNNAQLDNGFLQPFLCSVPTCISPLLTITSTTACSLQSIPNLTGSNLSTNSSGNNSLQSFSTSTSNSTSGSHYTPHVPHSVNNKLTQASNSVTYASSGNGSVRSSSSSSSCLSSYDYYQFLSNNSVTNSSATTSNDSVTSNEMTSGPSLTSDPTHNPHEFHESIKREKQSNLRDCYTCMFSESDIALATEPGDQVHFDPSSCHFSDDELRPRPMLRKSRKQAVPESQKDGKYWVRRAKNNMAAKKSREQRRLKENQVLLRASFLERQNQALRLELQLLRCENAKLTQFNQPN